MINIIYDFSLPIAESIRILTLEHSYQIRAICHLSGAQ